MAKNRIVDKIFAYGDTKLSQSLLSYILNAPDRYGFNSFKSKDKSACFLLSDSPDFNSNDKLCNNIAKKYD